MVALVVIYIVDLSGFTQTWLNVLSLYRGRTIKELKPFSCSLCMVWWIGLGYILTTGHLNLPMVAFVALLSFLSVPLGQVLILMREFLNSIISKLMDLL